VNGWDWFLAWVDGPGVEFNPAAHVPGDVTVIGVEADHVEDAGCVLSVEVERFSAGPISALRKRWAILSRSSEDGSTVTPRARGRVIALPSSRSGSETLTLKLECLPVGWKAAKRAACEPVKETPAFDPLLCDPDRLDEPTEILDGFSATVEFDRYTHAAVLTDIFGVGAPLIEIPDEDIDAVGYEEVETPISGVSLRLECQFTQFSSGQFGIGEALLDAFGGSVATLTPDDFVSKWPKLGAGVGDGKDGNSGYRFVASELAADEVSEVGPFNGSSDIYNYVADPNLQNPLARKVWLESTTFSGALSVGWSIKQKRREVFRFYLPVSGQDVALGNGDDREVSIRLQSVQIDGTTVGWLKNHDYQAGDRAFYAGRVYACNEDHHSGSDIDFTYWDALDSSAAPLPDPASSSYFLTARGKRSIVAGIYKARAVAAHSLRCVDVTVECALTDDVIAIQPWHRVRVQAPPEYLPGGVVEGKVYSVKWTARDGVDRATITLRVAPGAGTNLKPAAAQYTTSAGDNGLTQSGASWDLIEWSDFSTQIPASLPRAGLRSIEVVNGVADQIAYVQANDFNVSLGRDDKDATDPTKLVKDVPTSFTINLKPIGCISEAVHLIDCVCTQAFVGPRQIDLESE
jgi:hypothetical protein